jgi:hypothetical protein
VGWKTAVRFPTGTAASSSPQVQTDYEAFTEPSIYSILRSLSQVVKWLQPTLTSGAGAKECLGISLCSLVCLHGWITRAAYKVLLLSPFQNSGKSVATMMVNLMFDEGKSKM